MPRLSHKVGGVFVRGRHEVFLVHQVYPSLGVADVVPLGHEHSSVRTVAFESLESLEEEDRSAA